MSETKPSLDPLTAPTPRSRLKKLVVHRYRNVRPGTTLRFDDTWNLLVGKNGTGKTTLLRLLEGILTGDPARLGSHALHAEYEIEDGDARLSGSIEWNCGVWEAPAGAMTGPQRAPAEPPLLPFDVRIRGRMTGIGWPVVEWRYEAPSSHFEVSVNGQRRETFEEPPYTVPFPFAVRFPVFMGAETLPMWIDWVLSNFHRVRRFDEALGYFDALFGWSATLRSRSGTLKAIDNLARIDPATYAFLDRVRQTSLEDIHRERAATWSSKDDPVLREFESQTGIGDVAMELPVKRVDVAGDESTTELGPCRLRVTRPDGTLFFHDDLSFGQKRLIAFLYFMNNRPSPIVLADELSNGMHRAWIDLAVEKMAERQNIVAAQNPLILDRVGFQSAEEMQRSLIFCREEKGQLVWENAPLEEMRDVYRAYDVGLQHVSEILWQKGLW